MKLIAYSTGKAGGMCGSNSSTSITYTEDGRCKVSNSERPLQSQTTRIETYFADGLLQKLSEICERYHVIEWTDLPDEDIFMHDASTYSETFTFENGTKISLGSRKKTPAQAGEMAREINELIMESRKYGTDAEVTEESFLAMGMMMTGIGSDFSKGQEIANQGKRTIQLAKFCKNCGTPFEGIQKFCTECGSAREDM